MLSRKERITQILSTARDEGSLVEMILTGLAGLAAACAILAVAWAAGLVAAVVAAEVAAVVAPVSALLAICAYVLTELILAGDSAELLGWSCDLAATSVLFLFLFSPSVGVFACTMLPVLLAGYTVGSAITLLALIFFPRRYPEPVFPVSGTPSLESLDTVNDDNDGLYVHQIVSTNLAEEAEEKSDTPEL